MCIKRGIKMENILLSIGIALAVGLLMSRIVKRLKLPAVTGYLVGGILIGPYCLGRLGIDGIGFTNMDEVHNIKVLSEIALGFIAFSIGNEFRISQLRKNGKTSLIIGIVQALVATLVVDIGLYLLHLVLGERLPISVTQMNYKQLSLFDDYHFRQEQFVIDERKKKAPIEQMIG